MQSPRAVESEGAMAATQHAQHTQRADNRRGHLPALSLLDHHHHAMKANDVHHPSHLALLVSGPLLPLHSMALSLRLVRALLGPHTRTAAIQWRFNEELLRYCGDWGTHARSLVYSLFPCLLCECLPAFRRLLSKGGFQGTREKKKRRISKRCIYKLSCQQFCYRFSFFFFEKFWQQNRIDAGAIIVELEKHILTTLWNLQA